MTEKKKTYFTEKEQEAVQKLPVEEQAGFYHRLGEIAMRIKVADDTWAATSEKIEDDLTDLCDEIRERVKGL